MLLKSIIKSDYVPLQNGFNCQPIPRRTHSIPQDNSHFISTHSHPKNKREQHNYTPNYVPLYHTLNTNDSQRDCVVSQNILVPQMRRLPEHNLVSSFKWKSVATQQSMCQSVAISQAEIKNSVCQSHNALAQSTLLTLYYAERRNPFLWLWRYMYFFLLSPPYQTHSESCRVGEMGRRVYIMANRKSPVRLCSQIILFPSFLFYLFCVQTLIVLGFTLSLFFSPSVGS